MSRRSGIVAIVEGPGDKKAVPGLVRNILSACNYFETPVSRAIPTGGKPSLLRKFEHYLQYAVHNGGVAILVLLDADEECPREKADGLARRATEMNLNVPVAIVYAKREYETWFICSLAPDRGDRIRKWLELPADVTAPECPETIRDAKKWLKRHMRRHRSYKETVDQEPLTHRLELDLVQTRSRSFCRLWHAVEELVQAVELGVATVTPRPGPVQDDP